MGTSICVEKKEKKPQIAQMKKDKNYSLFKNSPP